MIAVAVAQPDRYVAQVPLEFRADGTVKRWTDVGASEGTLTDARRWRAQFEKLMHPQPVSVRIRKVRA